MEGSSNYFVKPEQVAVLPCLLCHSFPAAARLYLICLSFSTSPDSFCNPLFCNAWIAAVCSHPSLPSLRRQNVERVGNRLFFLPFHSSQVLSCIQSGKVAFSLSSDQFFCCSSSLPENAMPTDSIACRKAESNTGFPNFWG